MHGSTVWFVGLPLVLVAAGILAAWLTVRLRRGSGDRLRARRIEQPLAHELPYWAFVDDGGAGVAVHIDGSQSAHLELWGLDTDCLDNETLAQITTALHAIVQSLPPGAVLQFVHWTDGDVSTTIARYEEATAASEGIGRALVEDKVRDLRRRGGLRCSRLVVSVSPPPPAAPAGRRLPFRRHFPSIGPEEHAAALIRLRTLRDQLARALQAAGLRARPLGVPEVRRLAYSVLNPRRVRITPDPPPEDGSGCGDEPSAREQLVYAGLEERRDRLVLDGQLVRVLTLKSLPTATEPALLEALIVGLPFHVRLQVAIEALDESAAITDLKRRRDRAHLLANLRERRNQEAEAAERDVAELIDANLQSTLRMVRIAVTMVLSVDASVPDPGLVLDRQTAEVLRLFHGLHGAQAMVDDLGQLDEFLATLPGNARHGRRWRRCTSLNATHMLLAWQPWTGAASPPLLVENGRGHLVGYDPFDPGLDNPNACMAGTSGSGKSVTTNYLLCHLLAGGAKALIVDVGGSYRRLVDLFDGQYFAVQLDREPPGLNLFFPPLDIVRADGGLDEQRVQFVAAVVERMVADRGRESLTNAERAVVVRAIALTYDAAGHRTPILADLVDVLRDFPGDDPEDVAIARNLARALRVWTDGPAGRIVNRPSTIQLDGRAPLCAFDLKGLETQPDLQAVVLLILSGILWHLVMRDPTERKVVVFDEVWRLLAAPASARLVEELYRTSRKYRCSILTISQSVEDFAGSTIAPALINNAATVYLLRHRRGHDVAAVQWKLNERERQVFEALEMRRGQYTEALILHGEHHFLARIVLTPFEYWLATTHPPDLEIERRFLERHPGTPRLSVLRALATEHPHGAPSAAARDAV